jgi:hypothetical protein
MTRGQLLLQHALAASPGTTVLVLYGCGCCNDPYAARDVGAGVLHDWRDRSKSERRKHLKALIDEVMGL